MAIFLDSCIVVVSPFLLSNLVIVIYVITALYIIGPIGQDKDIRFTQFWTKSPGAKLQKPDKTRTSYTLEFNPSKMIMFKLKVIGYLYQ